jgi:hypothetical protein
MKTETEPQTTNLVARVNEIVPAPGRPLGWGHPRSSVTPQSHAIEDLALRIEALEQAVREISSEIHNHTSASNLSTDDAPAPV